MNLPLRRGDTSNVKMVFRADSFDICISKATYLASRDGTAKAFFWSSNDDSFDIAKGSNCYIFKECSIKERSNSKYPGSTYELKEGKVRKKLYSAN